MRVAALFPTSVTRPPLVTRQNKHKLCIPRSGFLPRAAATAATDSALLAQANPLNLSFQDLLRKGPSRQAALPEPPTESTFAAVIPWLVKLAVAESKSWWRIALAFMCLVGSKFAGMMCPVMIKNAIDAFSAAPNQPAQLIVSTATKFVLLYGLCDMLKHTFKELQAPLFTPVSQAAARRVAYHTFSHVLDLDIKYHLDRRTGRLSRILERGTRSIQMLYRAVIFTFVPTALELLIVCGVLAKAFNPLVGGLVLATFGAYVAWSVTLTQMAAAARKHVNTLDNATSAKAVDALLSYETVALFNNQKLEVAQYNAYLKEYFKATVHTERLAAVLNAGQAIILAGGLTAIMVTALQVGKGGAVSAGDLVMIQGLLLQLWAPLQFLGWFYRELRSALVDMEDFFAVLRTRSALRDGNQVLPASYQPASPPTLHQSIPALQHPTLVATNGNGRYPNSQPAAHSVSNGSYGIVPQDTMLFNDTIMQNIRYGRPESSEEEVVAAAKLAHLHDAVVRMPNAYSTVVGERGLKLSGGEKQRVAIARAFLRQPRLLICDEATSALDSATEAQIMASLNELAAGRTSVFVAHRLSTIRSCDTIVVLRDGLVAEQGSHEALMAQPEGLYRAMWELQAAEQQEDEGEEGAVAMGGEDLGGVSSLGASLSALGGLGPEAGSAECVQGSSQEANETEEMKAETELGLGWLPSPSSSSSTSSFSRDSSSLLSGSVNGHSATSGNGSGSSDGSRESLLHTAALR
ncbi:hypothetical protein V8C86DRAFT_448357 [Haematococcus lacustris]